MPRHGVPHPLHPQVNPLEEILDWSSFSVTVPEGDIDRLDTILTSIPPQRVLEMQGELRCAWPFFLYSQVYGAYAREPSGTDAFSGLMHVLWQRLVRGGRAVPRSGSGFPSPGIARVRGVAALSRPRCFSDKALTCGKSSVAARPPNSTRRSTRTGRRRCRRASW